MLQLPLIRSFLQRWCFNLPAATAAILLLIGTDLTQAQSAGQGCSVQSRLRVVFSPESKHFEILLLLRKLELSVREGPSETGEFWLSVPAGRSLEEAASMLRSSPAVEEVLIVRLANSSTACAK